MACFALLFTAGAFAGGRPRYGGTLQLAAVTKGAPQADPLLADAPVEAALAQLTAVPLCRLVEPSRPSPLLLRLTPLPGVSGEALGRALERVRGSGSPYRALLAGVKSVLVTAQSVELALEAPAPELERLLCHPALSMGPGPFSGPGATALLTLPDGRPYLDAVKVTATDARSAERALRERRAQVVLGSASTDEAPQLFATFLAVSSVLGAPLRTAVEASLDRGDLTRFFVRPPAAPMAALLPPALTGAAPPPPRPARPAPLTPAREVTLLFDEALDEHRAVAERLQVKLQPLGYRVALTALPRQALRARVEAHDYELALETRLLPPSAAGVVQLLAPARAAPLLSLTDERAREAKARELAGLLPAELNLVPLYVQGLGVTSARELQHLGRDSYGLVRLDDTFLSAE
jgi:MarR-like DNA-binding transcriptional regulator SgrR of sgrS sRNA